MREPPPPATPVPRPPSPAPEARPHPHAPGRRAAPASGSWSAVDTAAIVSVAGIAALLRLRRLGDPPSVVFDEVYYARDACFYVKASSKLCGIAVEQTQVHPPLGKWLIAAGIKLFGYDAFGWRIAAAVTGTVTVALLFLLARKLLASTFAALAASSLLAFDFLHFVQSRVAMLDVFATAFGVASVLCLAHDRDRTLQPVETLRHSTSSVLRPWRLAAGAMAGAALASKWSGALVVVLAVVVTIAWEASTRRADGRGRVGARLMKEEGLSLVLGLGVMPAIVYLGSYAARLEGRVLALPSSEGSWLGTLWDRQVYMLDFHQGLDAAHPYTSPPWSWLLLKRPVSYYFKTAENGDYLEILAIGNPLVWWVSIAALCYVAYRWWRARDLAAPEGLILAGFAFNFLPWFVLSGSRSAVFLFYMLPAVPFMCLAVAYVPVRLGWHRNAKPAVALCGAALLVTFAFYYPLLAKVPLPREDWLKRIWVFDECDRPQEKKVATASAGATRSPSASSEESSREPSGWCWI